ncbi:MAG: hypothetical protein QOG72_817 [Sphingomonadales bacterium]|jgi:hypothetical protein|nr:hypothetical protein [Sphingomonadales bacterium]
MAKDPLGRRPRPLTGRRIADYSDDGTKVREARMRKLVKGFWIDHPPQTNVIGRILAYRLATLDGEGEQDGLCLSQDSQVGKTATVKRVKHILEQDRLAQGEEPNPYQVIVVGLDQKTSLKSVLQDVLIQMKDPDWDYGTEKQLRQRILKFVERLGVELIIIDECQHLHKGGNDVADVTDAFKRFLDMGIAPLVLVGNLDAQRVFDRNPQFRARLGLPLTLPALNMKRTSDAIHFRNFVVGFDEILVSSKGFSTPSNLSAPATLDALERASGAYFGRVARIIKNAAIHAAARGALMVETYDLSCVVREYAIPSGWSEDDPFSAPNA